MTVIDIAVDRPARTLTLNAEYDATAERVWALWADRDLLGRWWGPPQYPATFLTHRLEVGSRSTYYMTGPNSERYYGYWDITSVAAPRLLQFVDGFADSDGTPDPAQPVSQAQVSMVAGDTTVRMTITTLFSSDDAMDKLLAMGMEDGLREAVGQIDELLRSVRA